MSDKQTIPERTDPLIVSDLSLTPQEKIEAIKKYAEMKQTDFDSLMKKFQRMILDALAQTIVPQEPIQPQQTGQTMGPFGGEAAKTTSGMVETNQDVIVGGVATVEKNRIVLMSVPQIAIINQTTVVSDADFRKALPDMQRQITNDFAQYWGRSAYLVFYTKDQVNKIPPYAWQVAALDTSDQAGALGYHDITASGQPLGKAFAKSDIDNGLSFTVTLTHEILEMIVDPDVNLQIATQFTDLNNVSHTRVVAYESCDAPESDLYGYLQVGGTMVTDFVTPAWFMPAPTVFPPGTKYDFRGHIPNPLGLLPGGYIGIQDDCGSWTQLTANNVKGAQLYKDIPRPGSRRERRARKAGGGNWLKSEI